MVEKYRDKSSASDNKQISEKAKKNVKKQAHITNKLHKISRTARTLLVALSNTMRYKCSPKSCRFCNRDNIWVWISRSEGGAATHR